jgi:Schlafen group 3, DNA/RNA helicase domain
VQHGVETAATFLSGNGPLVKVLREALIRDAAPRMGGRRPATRRAELLVQNVHEFIKEYGVNHLDRPPHENIIVFDEAQRAWNAAKLQKRHASLTASEAALVLEIMSRKAGWSTIVAIVGGGQEIHDGEAGLEAWGDALAASQVEWDVSVSPEALAGGTSVAGHRLFSGGIPPNVQLRTSGAMHLSVSVRSPRAQHFAEWINAVLGLDAAAARAALAQVTGYRLGLTRDLAVARRWLRDAAREDRRPGLLASSGSLRHRAYGLEMSPDFHRAYPIADWFLLPTSDVRSSHALEVALTEFECQGLELDYVGLCWGDDLTVADSEGAWAMREFKGSTWRDIRSAVKQQYLMNKYRVLLSRAREGMIVWVPSGEPTDPTREPARLDRTAEFLPRAGLELVSDAM